MGRIKEWRLRRGFPIGHGFLPKENAGGFRSGVLFSANPLKPTPGLNGAPHGFLRFVLCWPTQANTGLEWGTPWVSAFCSLLTHSSHHRA